MDYKLIEGFRLYFDAMAKEAHNTAIEKGWYSDTNGMGRNIGELIALIHSELSEALEAARQGNPPDDKLRDFSGLEVELADAIIRIMDMSGALHLDISGALIAKMKHNKTRPLKHGKRF